MADLILIKCGESGERETMPALGYESKKGCELGYREDEEALYIGTDRGNVRLCGKNDLAMILELGAAINSLSQTIEDITARLDALATSGEQERSDMIG